MQIHAQRNLIAQYLSADYARKTPPALPIVITTFTHHFYAFESTFSDVGEVGSTQVMQRVLILVENKFTVVI